MYADNMTKSMNKAIGETNRRRIIQSAHNEKYGITPTTVIKDIRDVIEATQIAEAQGEYDTLEAAMEADKGNIEKQIKKYEAEMRQAAKDLQFERAGQIRDILIKLQKRLK